MSCSRCSNWHIPSMASDSGVHADIRDKLADQLFIRFIYLTVYSLSVASEVWGPVGTAVAEVWHPVETAAARVWHPLERAAAEVWRRVEKAATEIWHHMKEDVASALRRSNVHVPSMASDVHTHILDMLPYRHSEFKQPTELLQQLILTILCATLTSLSVASEVWHHVEEAVASKRKGVPSLETGSPLPNPSSAQLRGDIQFSGITSFQDEFKPDKILCLFNRDKISSGVVEMVCFHKEGMASVIGIGLPFSKIIITSKSKIEVEQIHQDSWRQLWMAPSDGQQGNFKPFTFCSGVEVEHRNQSVVRQSTRDVIEGKSNPVTSLRVGGKSWFDQLLDDLKRLTNSEMKKVGKVPAGFGESAETSPRAECEMVIQENLITEDDAYEMLVKFHVEDDTKVFDQHSTEISRINGCPFVRLCLTVQFFRKSIANVTRPWSRHVSVRSKVDYLLNIIADPGYGWFQDDLRLSFGCTEKKDYQSPILEEEEGCAEYSIEEEEGCAEFSIRERATSNNGNSQSSSKDFNNIEAGEGSIEKEVPSTNVEFSMSKKSTRQKMTWEVSILTPIDSQSDDVCKCSDFKKPGMFSSVTTEAKGSWKLCGEGLKDHQFVVERVITQYNPSPCLEDKPQTLTQKVSKDLILNHSFFDANLHLYRASIP